MSLIMNTMYVEYMLPGIVRGPACSVRLGLTPSDSLSECIEVIFHSAACSRQTHNEGCKRVLCPWSWQTGKGGMSAEASTT